MCGRRSISPSLISGSLVLLLVIAGCTGLPSGRETHQGPNVTFVANNTEETTYTFEVFVVDVPANITVIRSDGNRVESAIGQGVGPILSGEKYYYTEVAPDPQATSHHGNFTVRAGEEVRSNITSLPQYGAVVAVVYDEQERISGFVEANCDDLALTYLGVTTDGEEVDVAYSCDGGYFNRPSLVVA